VQSFQKLTFSNPLKIMADPRRLAILRLLMAKPATLTQLGNALGEHPAWVRHHMQYLEASGLVKKSAEQVVAGHLEKVYTASARSYLIQELLLPEPSGRPLLVLSGSHDLAVEHLAEQVTPFLELLILPIGSLDGLVALRQGLCQMAGCHLYDSQSAEYNLPYVRHFFPDQPASLVTLAYRQQGLITAANNPFQVKDLSDLVGSNLRFINRNRGSGTRLWLDQRLQALGINPEQINGYHSEVVTHTEVAEMIHYGRADVGLGIQAAAHAAGLHFIPLFQERFDLIFHQMDTSDQAVQRLIDHLSGGLFRQYLQTLPGYESAHTGEAWHTG
jgi:putative molybdopterin biosynthesis protein